jgi:hypothetical protein
MDFSLNKILAPVDRASVERERDRLREELEDCEALLRLIDRHGSVTARAQVADSQPPRSSEADAQTYGHGNGNGNGNGNVHIALSEKRDAVLAIMRERPGRWRTKDMRDALAARGIDPQAGTPVKNVMWQLAKAGTISPSGSGIYEYPPLSAEPDDPRVQEAMGL